MQFYVDIERDTFFEACDAIRSDPGKLHVYEMPPFFYQSENMTVISRILDLPFIGMSLSIMMIILMFYFYIGSNTPLHMNMMIFFVY